MEKKTVLIIDDEVDLCLLMKAYFLRKNYRVYLAHTLAEGEKMIDETFPDILFIDNNLPDGAGWDIIPDTIKKAPHTSYHLTSAFRSVLPEDLNKNMVTVWEKPISLKDLDRVFPTN
jgi:DNA-binding NtrC family response regulator